MYTTISANPTTLVRSFFARTYSWMFSGLLLTAIIAYLTSNNVGLLERIEPMYVPLLFAELGLVLAISFLLPRISAMVASVLFMLYAGMTGLTFAVLMQVYTATDISAAFAITAGMFGTMTLLGLTTKVDLSRFGTILFMAVIGLVIASVVNIFFASGPMAWILSVATVVIFSALTAYDTQRLRGMALAGIDAGSEHGEKMAVFGALSLYINFINMFLAVLRMFGLSRD